MQINFIFNDNVRIFYLSCNIKKSKTTAKLSEKSWNKRCSKRFQMRHLWRQRLYGCHFFLLLNRNRVPEKLYFGQWPCITNIYPVNAIFLLKQNQCRIKSNIVAVSFVVGCTQCTWRQPSTCCNYWKNFITWNYIKQSLQVRNESNSQLKWWYGLTAYINVNQSKIRTPQIPKYKTEDHY